MSASFLRFFAPPHLQTRPHPAAFTLIELLTVIAIIGILAAILIPTVGSVRTQARQAQCVSNLRQIGVALATYADAHRGAFPETSHGAAADLEQISWVYTLRPYLGDVDEVRLCPLDPRREERLRLRLSSFVLNDYLDAKTYYDPFGRPAGTVPRLSTLREPARTPTVFVGADTLALDLSSDHIHAREWPGNWSQVTADIAPDRFRYGARSRDHDDGRAPYLFADGHVKTLAASELRRRVDAGEDFALPR
jgi:prepilin-type N-terminal cleavage/methylation domain-containing protein/prepilin-type processing-associated H-X9-DG protein